MKPRNFPGARNYRRGVALRRLLEMPRDQIGNLPAWEREVASLKASVVPQEKAWDHRSKKFRGNTK